jgi:hypothetical protein
MWSFRNLKGVAAASALIATIGVAGAPAHAALVANALVANGLAMNALTSNALAAGGSAIGDLNGVAVEAVRRDRIDRVAGPRDAPSGKDEEEEIEFDQLSQVDPGAYR